MSRTVSAGTICPGCHSHDVKVYPASQHTGITIVGCRTCGLRALADPSIMDVTPEQAAATDAAYNYAAYVSVMRESATEDDRVRVLTRLEQMMKDRRTPSLFDLGAGDGRFCDHARGFGFEVTGNELSAEAVALAKERYDVDLSLGTLDDVGFEHAHDVLTMWCVLAHVQDVDGLLSGVHRLLKPGGVLYLQTPRFSVADRAGVSALSMSGGRLSKLVDTRISTKHWMLHTARSITALLERHGFADVQAMPQARFSLTSDFYLRSLGLPDKMVGPTSKAMDFAIERGAVPRIVLDVYARKA